MKDNFILYLDYEAQFKKLTDRDKGRLLMALFSYARGEDISNTLSPIASMAYEFITRQMGFDYEKYKARCEKNRSNGCLGGRPAKDCKQEKTPKNQMVFDENQKKPNGYFENPNNDNDNDNDINMLVNNNNIINNNPRARTYARTCEIIAEFYSWYYKTGFPTNFDNYADEIIYAIAKAVAQSNTPEQFKYKGVIYNLQSMINIVARFDKSHFLSLMETLMTNMKINDRYAYIIGSIISITSQTYNSTNTTEQIQALTNALKKLPSDEDEQSVMQAHDTAVDV